MTASAHETILRIEHLTKHFPLEGGKVLTACDDVTFPVYRGDILGIVGESGCGKSTLVRTLMQLHPPSEGKIFFKDQEITGLKGEDARNMRRNIQMVFQDPFGSLDPRWRIERSVAEPLRLHHPDWSDERVGARVAESLRMVDLDPKDFLNRFPMDLSGGQAQRAAIARAIVDHPRILLADEPMSAIDVAARIRILDSFRRIRQAEPDMALIMVSHDLGVVRHIADRIVVLHDGRVEESGLTGEVLDAPRRDYTRELIRAASL